MNGLALSDLINKKAPFSAFHKSLSEFSGSQPLSFVNNLDDIVCMFCVCVFRFYNLTFYNSFNNNNNNNNNFF